MTSSYADPSIEASDGNEVDPGIDPNFVACLESEAELLQQAITEGASPMAAHAKTMLWLDTLVKMHAVGLDESLKTQDATQAAVWSRDLASLELALVLIQNVKPLNTQDPSN